MNTLIAEGPLGVPFWANSSSPVIVNSTIANNQNACLGIYTTYNAAPVVSNTIIVGNGSPTGGNGLTTLNYSLYDSALFAAVVGPGNIQASSPLLDPPADYAPLPGSPPLVFSRAHAAPNPYNPGTAIRFTLSESAEVRVDLFDARGVRINSLLPGVMFAGTHGLGWDGTDRNGGALPFIRRSCPTDTLPFPHARHSLLPR